MRLATALVLVLAALSIVFLSQAQPSDCDAPESYEDCVQAAEANFGACSGGTFEGYLDALLENCGSYNFIDGDGDGIGDISGRTSAEHHACKSGIQDDYGDDCIYARILALNSCTLGFD